MQINQYLTNSQLYKSDNNLRIGKVIYAVVAVKVMQFTPLIPHK